MVDSASVMPPDWCGMFVHATIAIAVIGDHILDAPIGLVALGEVGVQLVRCS